MQWIIERDLFFANEQQRFIEALKERGIRPTFVSYVPFSHEITPLPTETANTIGLGSTNFVRAAKKLSWMPGIWHNDNFRFEVWKEHIGVQLLNHDGYVIPFREAMNISFGNGHDRFFIRPAEDLKAFSGGVVHQDRLAEWHDNVLRYAQMMDEPDLVNDWTPIVVAEAKALIAEYRFFVVAGRVVTGCESSPAQVLIEGPTVANSRSADAWYYAQRMVDVWQPADAFVIDIAITAYGGFRVLEYNCFNSAGLYACDAGAIIDAVERAFSSAEKSAVLT